MNLLIVITLFGLIYWKIKNQYYNRLDISSSHKLEDISDSLNILAVNGKVSSDDWRYKYVNMCINIAKKELPCYNLYLVIYLYYRHRNDSEIKKTGDYIKNHIKDNSDLAKIYKEYQDVVAYNMLSKIIWIKVLVVFFAFSRSQKIKLKKVTDSISIFPETSPNLHYC